MKIMVPIFLCFALALADPISPTPEEVSKFAAYIQDFGKSYTTEDLRYRVQIFAKNLRRYHAHNSGNSSYQMGVTPFSDLTSEEFEARLGYVPLSDEQLSSMVIDPTENSTAPLVGIDWVAKGKVTAVKYQKVCNSCYVFGAVGSVESSLAIRGFGLANLAEQNFLDCNTAGLGCSNGNAGAVVGWVQNNGICKTADYPYVGKVQTCKSCNKVVPKGWITGIGRPGAYTEAGFATTLNSRPLTVVIDARTMDGYSGGIFDDSACTKTPNHQVLIVGYGTANGKDYWKIKNSWATQWGEKGYMRMARGKNMCNIVTKQVLYALTK